MSLQKIVQNLSLMVFQRDRTVVSLWRDNRSLTTNREDILPDVESGLSDEETREIEFGSQSDDEYRR